MAPFRASIRGYLEENGELPEPADLAAEAITELEAVVDDLREIVALVEKEENIEK